MATIPRNAAGRRLVDGPGYTSQLMVTSGPYVAFRLGCVAYNLLAGFRETVLPRCWVERRLRAGRDFVFLVGADLIPQGRGLQIRFAVPWEERGEFLARLRTLSAG